jgi:hypothetical protein
MLTKEIRAGDFVSNELRNNRRQGGDNPSLCRHETDRGVWIGHGE